MLKRETRDDKTSRFLSMTFDISVSIMNLRENVGGYSLQFICHHIRRTEMKKMFLHSQISTRSSAMTLDVIMGCKPVAMDWKLGGFSKQNTLEN